MAIYDADGTANLLIKYIYDNDATTNPQIYYVYDNDNTTNRMIYSRSVSFFPGTTVQVRATNRGNYGSFYVNEGVVGGTTNVNGPVVYIPVNLTGINTLTINCTGYTTGVSSCAGIWLASPSLWSNDYYQGTPYYTIGVGTNTSYYTLVKRVIDGASLSSFSWNVSAYTGTYYLACAVYLNSLGSNCTAGVTITSVVGT